MAEAPDVVLMMNIDAEGIARDAHDLLVTTSTRLWMFVTKDRAQTGKSRL